MASGAMTFSGCRAPMQPWGFENGRVQPFQETDPATEPLANVMFRKVGTAAVGAADPTDCSESNVDDLGRWSREKDIVNSRKSSAMKESASHGLSVLTIGTLFHFLLRLEWLTAGAGCMKGGFSVMNLGLFCLRIGRRNGRGSTRGQGCCNQLMLQMTK